MVRPLGHPEEGRVDFQADALVPRVAYRRGGAGGIQLDPLKATWRMRGGRRLRPKIATKDISRIDLSHRVARDLDRRPEGVTRELQRIADCMNANMRLGLKAAALIDRRVPSVRAAELLGSDVPSAVVSAAISALERELLNVYGTMPRYQLRWLGRI